MLVAKYIKNPVEVKIERVQAASKITTLEGSQQTNDTQYLVTGIKGEQYAIESEVFAEYSPVDGREGYYSKPLTQEPVWVAQLAYPINIHRPGWEHAGKAGDYLVFKAADDQYVIDKEVFEVTYSLAS